MKFRQTKLKGAYIIELDRLSDERGFFARTFCQKEFKAPGIEFEIVQSSISYNKNKGTLRGMHYQSAPYQEAKLVSCVRGAIYDVIIDLKPKSPTYCNWFSAELSQDNYKIIYVPEGFAHGFQSLTNDTIVSYQMAEFYHQECARGIRWDDRLFKIKWPLKVKVISQKDIAYDDFVK